MPKFPQVLKIELKHHFLNYGTEVPQSMESSPYLNHHLGLPKYSTTILEQ